MGEVELATPLTDSELKSIGEKLTDLGFEILDTKAHKQVEKIKNLLIKKVQSGEIEEHFSLSEFLSKAQQKPQTLFLSTATLKT
ncbi:hypothetical protein GCM10023229_32410 [Flavisolibacter ginsenosidimutans]